MAKITNVINYICIYNQQLPATAVFIFCNLLNGMVK